MPWSVLEANGMQATPRVHHRVANTTRQQADLVWHAPEALHPAKGLFDPAANGRELTIRRLLRGVSSPPRGFFLGGRLVTLAKTAPWTPIA